MPFLFLEGLLRCFRMFSSKTAQNVLTLFMNDPKEDRPNSFKCNWGFKFFSFLSIVLLCRYLQFNFSSLLWNVFDFTFLERQQVKLSFPVKSKSWVIFGERFGEVSLKEKLGNQDGILFRETVKAFPLFTLAVQFYTTRLSFSENFRLIPNCKQFTFFGEC